ncbi:MAG: hypothetical protein MJ245_04830 [Clostridia bacterium]|nr:hypothetical protein [Clostridia bacterium]
MKIKKHANAEPKFKEKFNYTFDKLMSKGTIALGITLFIVVILVGIILGVFAFNLSNEESLLKAIWDSFTNMLDPGVVSGVEYNNYGYLIPMLLATLFGIFFTAVLIGIITQAISDKVEGLRKGQSRILAKKHFLIIGWNERVTHIIGQLIFSFEGSGKKHTIVVIGRCEKIKMEDTIRNYLTQDFMDEVEKASYDNPEKYKKKMRKIIKQTTIVCRGADFADRLALLNCNVRQARSIIINKFDDLATMKTLLALNSISSERPLSYKDPYIVCCAMKKENTELFRTRGEGEWKKYVLFFSDAISKITARSCLHPGVSAAFDNLFSFNGSEIHIERPRDYEKLFLDDNGNKKDVVITFGSLLNKVRRGAIIGYKRKKDVFLNPPFDTQLLKSDKLIIVEQEQHDSYILEEPNINVKNYNLQTDKAVNDKENILVFGCNANMPQILAEANKYLEEGSLVVIACSFEQLMDGLRTLEVEQYDINLHNEKFDILSTNINEAHGVEYYNKVQNLLTKYIIYQNRDTISDISDEDIKCNIDIRFKLTDIYSSGSFDVLMERSQEFLHNKLDHILVLSDNTLDADSADEKTLFLLMNLRHKFEKNNINITTEMRKASNEVIAQNSSVDDFIISDSIVSNMLTQILKDEYLYEIFEDILDVDGAEIYLEPFKNYINFDEQKDQEFNFYEITKIVSSKSNRIPIGYRGKNGGSTAKVVLNPSKRKIITINENDLVIVVANEK